MPGYPDKAETRQPITRWTESPCWVQNLSKMKTSSYKCMQIISAVRYSDGTSLKCKVLYNVWLFTRDATILKIILNSSVRHPRFNTCLIAVLRGRLKCLHNLILKKCHSIVLQYTFHHLQFWWICPNILYNLTYIHITLTQQYSYAHGTLHCSYLHHHESSLFACVLKPCQLNIPF